MAEEKQKMREKWTDHKGKTWPEPTTKGALMFWKTASHAALRAFVFQRDGFQCRSCGAAPDVAPSGYDGYSGVLLAGQDWSWLELDHVVSRRNGGRHHPSNLQTLCNRCNARKSVQVDRKGTPK